MRSKGPQVDTTIDGAQQLLQAIEEHLNVLWDGKRWIARTDIQRGDLIVSTYDLAVWDEENNKIIPGKWATGYSALYVTSSGPNGSAVQLPTRVGNGDDKVELVRSLLIDIQRWLEEREDIPSVPLVPWNNNRADMPSALPVLAILEALHDGSAGAPRFKPSSIGLTYEYNSKAHKAEVSYRPTDHLPSNDETIDDLIRQVRTLGDLEADVLFASLVHWLNAQHTVDEATWITAANLLDYRNIAPITKPTGPGRRRDAGHRTEDIREVAESMARLDHFWVTVADAEVLEAVPGTTGKKHKDRRKKTLTLQSKYISIEDQVTQTGLDGISLPIAWHYRPGSALRAYLEHPNWETAPLARKVLEYHRLNQLWEKRLSQLFTIHVHIARNNKDPLRRRIGRMLETARLTVNKRNPEWTRKRFEKAMNTIAADGIIPGWDYTPKSQEILNHLPARGWLPQYLDLVVEIAPMQSLSGETTPNALTQ